jgi:predicted transcriptional regulator YdeE
MEMNCGTIETIEGFRAEGRTIRTTNEGGASARDQGSLWESLMREGFLFSLLAASGEKAIWGIYSNYEKDWTMPYDFTLAARKEDSCLSPVEPELAGGRVISVPSGDYAAFRATAANAQEACAHAWQAVWTWSQANPGKRAYAIDLERWHPAELVSGGAVSVVVYISLK